MNTLNKITKGKIKDTLANTSIVIDSALIVLTESISGHLDSIIEYINKNKDNLDTGRLICKIRSVKQELQNEDS